MSGAGKTLLLGYVGKGNLGDDLMVEAIATRLPQGSWEVIDGRVGFFALLTKLLRARRIIVCGGGVVSRQTGSYQRVLFWARLLGVRRNFFSIEMSGWPPGRRGKMQQFIMRDADISTRTFESGAICQRQLPLAEINNVQDLFFLNSTFDCQPVAGTVERFGRLAITAGSGGTVSTRRIIVLPRSFADSGSYPNSRNVARILAEVDRICGKCGKLPVLLSPSADVDDVTAYGAALADAGHAVTDLDKECEVTISDEDHMITNRLHIGKCCAFYSIPHTLVSYDRKTELPELVGQVGEILQLSGSLIAVEDLAISMQKFKMRRQMSLAILAKSLNR